MIAAEVAEDGSLKHVHERSADSFGAIGSLFKLYVLGIVTDQVAGGDLSWDDPLIVTAADKSLPPGDMRERPDGSMVTVRAAATLMMSHDNTATDLLIKAVGRDRVEYILPTMGMGEESQALTLPLLTTREQFVITLAVDASFRERYAAGSADTRRRLLLALAGDLPTAAAVDGATPVGIGTINWFASPIELVRARLWLESQRGLPGLEPLEEILAAESAEPIDAATWTRYEFSRGSGPGVLSLSWLLQHADGRRFVVAIVANDSAAPVDERSVEAVADGVIGLLATA